MTDLVDVLRLEIDLAPVQNLIVNHSGQIPNADLRSGGQMVASTDPVPIRQDGYSWKLLTNTTGFLPTPSRAFKVNGGEYLGVQASIYQAAGTSSTITPRIRWYDVNGFGVTTIPATDLSPKSATVGNATVLAWTPVPVPANAATAVLTWNHTATPTAPAYLSRLMVVAGATPGAATKPFTPQDWVNILNPTTSIRADRGNDLEGVQESITVGALMATVKDPAVDPAVNPAMRPGRAIRITCLASGQWEPTWTGTVEKLNTRYGKNTIVTLTAADAGRPLTGTSMATTGDPTYTYSSLYAVAGNAAARCGLYYRFDGTNAPAQFETKSFEDSAKAGDWVRRAINGYGGAVYVDRRNWVQINKDVTTPAWRFTDNPEHVAATDVYYTDIDTSFGTEAVVNELIVRRINTDETDDDGAKEYGPYLATSSQSQWGPQSATVETTGGSPSAIASDLLGVFATPKPFPETVEFSGADHLRAAATLEPTTVVHVNRGALIDGDYQVLAIAHEINPRGWKVTVTFRLLPVHTSINMSVPPAGADTGPGDITAPEPGLLGSVCRADPFNVQHDSQTMVPYNTVVTADGITWDATNRRFTVPKDGRYSITGQASFAPNAGAAAGRRLVQLFVNGVQIKAQMWTPTTGLPTSGEVHEDMPLKAGDVVAIGCLQTSGAPLGLHPTAATNRASITYIGP